MRTEPSYWWQFVLPGSRFYSQGSATFPDFHINKYLTRGELQSSPSTAKDAMFLPRTLA
jgi:hypothetical protein